MDRGEMVSQQTFNLPVPGSNPGGPTKYPAIAHGEQEAL